MNRAKFVGAIIATVVLGVSANSAFAHHSSAMYDRTKEVTLSGVVKEFQWTNPHTWLQVVVSDKSGKTVEWSIEGGAVSLMKRAGWAREGLKPGDKVDVVFYQLKDGDNGGTVIQVTKSDGKVFKYHG